jgi:hypothetical protein
MPEVEAQGYEPNGDTNNGSYGDNPTQQVPLAVHVRTLCWLLLGGKEGLQERQDAGGEFLSVKVGWAFGAPTNRRRPSETRR